MAPQPRRRAVVSVSGALDGVGFDVQLSEAEAVRLRGSLAPFIAVARPVTAAVEPVAVGATSRRLHAARRRALLGEAAAADGDGDALTALIGRTAEIYSQAVSQSTRKDYGRRWRAFERWCDERQFEALPARPETVMLYLADCSDSASALSTLRGRLAAINRVHVEDGHRPPSSDPGMTLLMRGLSRTQSRRRTGPPVSALRIADLRQILRNLEKAQPKAARDRAMITLHTCGVSYGELARLRWSDVDIGRRRLVVRLRAAVNGPVVRDLKLPAATEPATCPYEAMVGWHLPDAEPVGFVFTTVDALGHRNGTRLDAAKVARIVASRTESLGAASDDPFRAAAGSLAETPSDVLRDRCLLLLGWAGAFRRSELTALSWSDLSVSPAGLRVRIRRSKTDPAGHGRTVGIPHGQSALTCPVLAFTAWRSRVETQLGSGFRLDQACFPPLGRAGRIGTRPLTPEAVSVLVKRRATAAGLEGRWSGRSLRAGFISTAADLNLPLEAIAQQSRHQSLDQLIRYIRQDDPFRRNAASWVGL